MKKSSELITFVIFTFNEEKRIEFPLQNYAGYGDILVVDNESTDNTRAIAKKYGAKVLTYKNPGWVETKEEMEFVFKQIKTPWVCLMSADEMISKKCLSLFNQIAQEDKYKVVIQNKRTLLYKEGTNFIPGFINIHFFKVGALEFTGNTMHQRGKFSKNVKKSEILYLPPLEEYSVYHFSLYNAEGLIRTVNTYSNFQAKAIPAKNIAFNIIFVPMYQFIFYFIFGGLFRLGVRGFIMAVELSMYYFLSYAKAYELKHNITIESIEQNFQKDKKRILQSSPNSNIVEKIYAKIVVTIISFLHKRYKK